ncbi:MAG: helix-turn-helix transcriptional regulator [bacterium]|jgi:ribosome-binding protein aMBF1 (putative translation factor)|nr:helix-turn-helix transcriptional regulator [bacterium]
MDKAKRKRLEAKGWKIGDASNFLSLTPEEASYVELKLSFCQNLKDRRQQKQLTQAQLAKMIKSSQSRVAKMEAGDPTVSLDLLVRSLLALGVSKRELGQAISKDPVLTI